MEETIDAAVTIVGRGPAIAEELRRRIVLNELAPGTVLTELALAAELGSSQGAIREALLRLEGEGLVVRARAIRARSSPISTPSEAAEMLALAPADRGPRRAARLPAGRPAATSRR